MKKIIIFLIAFIAMVSMQSNTVAWAGQETKIIMVDDELNFEYLACDVSPIVENGATLVPLRAIAEKLNFNVVWDKNNQTILISDAENTLQLTVGSTVAVANSKTILMTTAPRIANNRTFIPLRYVSEFFGQQVTWLKGIDNNFYIWVSSLALLRNEDTDVSNNDNYYVISDDPAPYYALKPDGQTAKGIKIGDTFDKVVEKYGKAHRLYTYNDEISAKYYALALPNAGVSVLTFTFENNKVTEVNLDPPV